MITSTYHDCLFIIQATTFPEAGTVYDYFFNKKGNGNWVNWVDAIDKTASEIPAGAMVKGLTTACLNY